jgi:hypothetical protein
MSGFTRYREHISGSLIAAIGAFAVVEGQTYGIGKLTSMGSGFFPVMLGVGMILCGVLMVLFPQTPVTGHANLHKVDAPDWRAAAAISGGVIMFMALAKAAGLAPAIFACVFVSALGVRKTTLREAALLALGVMVFGVLLFSYGLKVPFPIIAGVLY